MLRRNRNNDNWGYCRPKPAWSATWCRPRIRVAVYLNMVASTNHWRLPFRMKKVSLKVRGAALKLLKKFKRMPHLFRIQTKATEGAAMPTALCGPACKEAPGFQNEWACPLPAEVCSLQITMTWQCIHDQRSGTCPRQENNAR